MPVQVLLKLHFYSKTESGCTILMVPQKMRMTTAYNCCDICVPGGRAPIVTSTLLLQGPRRAQRAARDVVDGAAVLKPAGGNRCTKDEPWRASRSPARWPAVTGWEKRGETGKNRKEARNGKLEQRAVKSGVLEEEGR
ncbi:hypothetical protein MTO96_011034 [Rhipicephalus appendiculatus]